MPSFLTKEGRHFVSYITGPSHVLLGVKFTNQVSDPKLIKQPSQGICSHGKLDEDQIRQVVQEALAAFREEGSSIYAEEILYVENDSPRYDLFHLAAYSLVKQYVDGGEFKDAT